MRSVIRSCPRNLNSSADRLMSVLFYRPLPAACCKTKTRCKSAPHSCVWIRPVIYRGPGDRLYFVWYPASAAESSDKVAEQRFAETSGVPHLVGRTESFANTIHRRARLRCYAGWWHRPSVPANENVPSLVFLIFKKKDGLAESRLCQCRRMSGTGVAPQ